MPTTRARRIDDLSPGTRVGPYVVSDEVGRGGMGTVYRAERSDGLFEQTVALKVVKRGMDTDAVLRRFEAERRILGRLEHPGIARVLDGGQTEDGRPWLAMEFVDGVPITDYADDHRLGVDARTDLFRQVCDAVGYAHRQLVVHRDLKPSNVLVTADGRVKLLDFGIAKLIGVEGEATQTALTQPGHVVLTPAYAAPEQILGAPISTAFDVYALGVLLYEMLSGQRPHALEDARPGSLQRMATAAAPPRPSTAVGAVQATHGTPPERVRRQLVGDLDTICLAALRKEPERRYASVDALADDLRRYREGLPVQARPDTAGYRARKFIRRHRASLAAGAASLAIISVVTVLAFIRVGAERDRAETEAQTATEVSDFLAGLFTGADPAQTSGADATARQLLAAGTARVREDLDGQPEVQSRMLHTIGTVYARLDEYTAAEDALNDALALRERVLGPDHPDVAVTQSGLAFLYERQGRFPDSEQAASAAVATLRDHTDTHASPLADALHRLAFAQARLIQVEAAERHIREAVALKEELYGPRSAEVAYSMNILGDVMNYAGRLDDAERIHLAALAIREETIGTDHFHTSHTYHNLAVVYRGMEQWPEAEQFYREALRVKQIHHGEGSAETGRTLSQLGHAIGMQGRFEEASRLHDAAVATTRGLDAETGSLVAPMLVRRGDVLRAEGRLTDAETSIRRGIRLWQRSVGTPTPLVPRWLLRLSEVVGTQGRQEEATQLVAESRALCDGLPLERQRDRCISAAEAAL